MATARFITRNGKKYIQLKEYAYGDPDWKIVMPVEEARKFLKNKDKYDFSGRHDITQTDYNVSYTRWFGYDFPSTQKTNSPYNPNAKPVISKDRLHLELERALKNENTNSNRKRSSSIMLDKKSHNNVSKKVKDEKNSSGKSFFATYFPKTSKFLEALFGNAGMGAALNNFSAASFYSSNGILKENQIEYLKARETIPKEKRLITVVRKKSKLVKAKRMGS